MDSIHESISEMLYDLSVFSQKTDFSGMLCSFIFKVKEYIKLNKKKKDKLGELKYKILLLLEFLKKRKEKYISGQSRVSVENSLNELIFVAGLNDIKAIKCEKIDDENINELYRFIEKTICFSVPETKNDYSLWCFLQMAFILSDIYGNMKNNIINDDFELCDIQNSVLKFTYGENNIELLYNYKTFIENPIAENAIYLIVKKQGKTPSSFMFCTSEKKQEIDVLHEVARTLDNNKFLIFSGVFLLYKSNEIFSRLRNGVGIIAFERNNFTETANLLSKICVYENSLKYPKITASLNDMILKYQVEARNVLVVTVKSKEQLEINIRNDFYHMPAYQYDLSKYEYIAVYQSANLFGALAGIVYFGEIKSIKKVRRREILEIPKDSDELYYRIEIVFRALDKRLAPTGSIKTFAETSYRLLCEMENVSDLFIRSYDEYLTLNFLRKNFKNSVVMGDEEGIRAMIAQKIKIEFYPDRVILYKDGREVVVAERIFYRNNINAFFKKITEI